MARAMGTTEVQITMILRQVPMIGRQPPNSQRNPRLPQAIEIQFVAFTFTQSGALRSSCARRLIARSRETIVVEGSS
jgi:hypothetical protein